MTRRRKIELGISGILFLWLLMTGRLSEGFFFVFGDAMDWSSRSLAGPNATNCGTVNTHGNPTGATNVSQSACRFRFVE
jgi:hypothetical protein